MTQLQITILRQGKCTWRILDENRGIGRTLSTLMIGYKLKHDVVRQLGNKQVHIYFGTGIVFDLRETKFDV